MNEQRRQILEMLAEGKINAEEAERLLAALDREDGAPTPRKGRPSTCGSSSMSAVTARAAR